jgi:hsp70-interacting protein
MEGGERPLRNLRSVLHWSVEQQCKDESLKLSDEDRAWLNEAVRHYTGADDVTVMQECLKILQESKSGEEADKQPAIAKKEEALEVIADKVESIDNAQDFITIGGLPIIFNFLQTKETVLQWRAADVLSVVVQNNPRCQSQVFVAGGLEILMHAIEDSQDDHVKIKVLYALSSLTRGFPDALKAFITGKGISVITRAMQSDSEKLRVKAVFMLKNIIEEQPDITDHCFHHPLLLVIFATSCLLAKETQMKLLSSQECWSCSTALRRRRVCC